MIKYNIQKKVETFFLIFICLSISKTFATRIYKQLPTSISSQQTAAKSKKLRTKQQCSLCLREKKKKCFYTLSCGHYYCKGCLLSIMNYCLETNSLRTALCPEISCRTNIKSNDMKQFILHEPLLEAIKKIKSRESLMKKPYAIICPTADCDAVFANKENHKTVTCPNCNKTYCSQCRKGHNETESCKEHEDKENKLNEDWKKANTKQCPMCNAYIEKRGGCNHMKCTKCLHNFCWMCRNPWFGHRTACGTTMYGY